MMFFSFVRSAEVSILTRTTRKAASVITVDLCTT